MSAIYSISDIETMTGVKAHTLRIWEKRYGVVNPKRTEKNIRYFTDDQLQDLLNISFLNNKGFKISKIASLTPKERQNQIDALLKQEKELQKDIVKVTISNILKLDQAKCNLIFDKKIAQIGFEETMYEFVYPLLDRLSMMWISGSMKSVHERFIRNIIRSKVIHEIEQIKQPLRKSSFLLFLREGEDQELSILFLEYILKLSGAYVINLGSQTSTSDVIHAIDICQPNFIFTLINENSDSESLQSYVDFVSNYIQGRNIKFLISGFQIQKQNVQLNEDCHFVKSLEEVKTFV